MFPAPRDVSFSLHRRSLLWDTACLRCVERAGSAHQGRDFPVSIHVDERGWIHSLRDRNGTELVSAQEDRPFGSLLFADRNSPYKVVTVGQAKTANACGAGDPSYGNRPGTTRLWSGRLLPRTAMPRTSISPSQSISDAFADKQGRIAIAFPLDTSESLWLDGAGFVYRVPQDVLPGGAAPQFTTVSFVHFEKAWRERANDSNSRCGAVTTRWDFPGGPARPAHRNSRRGSTAPGSNGTPWLGSADIPIQNRGAIR